MTCFFVLVCSLLEPSQEKSHGEEPRSWQVARLSSQTTHSQHQPVAPGWALQGGVLSPSQTAQLVLCGERGTVPAEPCPHGRCVGRISLFGSPGCQSGLLCHGEARRQR